MMDDLVGSGFILRYGGDGDSGPPFIDFYGHPAEAEFSEHRHRGIVLVVVGYCLRQKPLRAAEFAAAVDRAVVDGAMADRAAPRSVLDRVSRWPGSYSAIVASRDGVAASADLAGQFPLYYSRRADEVLLGSDPRMLAARHDRLPDPVTAAINITCPAVLPLWSGRSPYSGMGRLEGGSVLRAAFGGGSLCVDIDSSCQPLPVPGATLAEGAAMLREALVAAVRARCGDQAVSSDFSGGIDSTTIAFLAASASRSPVASVIYHQPHAPAADIADAVQFAALQSRIRLSVVTGSARTLPFAELPALCEPTPQEPAPQALAGQAATLRLAAASSSGARLHLTGEGGDALLLAAPAYLGSLAQRRDARVLLRHCGGYARLRYASSAAIARRAFQLARTRPSQALGQLARELEQPSSRPLNWTDLVAWWPPSDEAATWLTPRMRRQLADIAGDPATARSVPAEAGPADLAALADLRRSGDAQRYLRQAGGRLGLAVHAPFLDAAVIRAALGVPAYARADPGAYKPLLRAAMEDLVPAQVLGRRTKGDYSAEDYRGARRSSGALRALLRDSRLADLEVIEPGVIGAVLDRMTSGVAVPLGPINMLLATETWLRSAEVKVGVPARC